MLSLMLATGGCANGGEVNLDFANLGWIDVIILGIVQGITELLPRGQALKTLHAHWQA